MKLNKTPGATCAHLFYPENDLALAINLANYTPPRMARALHLSGETLPMWYGAPGDAFICHGVNDRWFRRMADAFGLQTDVFPHRPELYTPQPWGWSAASRRAFIDAGFNATQLPGDEQLTRIRELSHRRSSVLIAESLTQMLPEINFTRPAVEASSVESALDAISAFNGNAVLKSPWSNAGRGITFIKGFSEEALLKRLDDTIAAYGSVLIEPHHNNVCDFALLFDALPGGQVCFKGLSVFETDARGAYARNVIASDQILFARLEKYVASSTLRLVAEKLESILSTMISDCYAGPLGVDMLITAEGVLDPCVELNLRNTMGHVSHSLAKNVLAPGIVADFYSEMKATEPVDDPLAGLGIDSGRLYSGALTLNPPGCPFRFCLAVRNA